MNTFAPHARPATSLLDLLAASEVPPIGPKFSDGSLFHSLLEAATDVDHRTKLAPAASPATPPRPQFASVSITGVAARVTSRSQTVIETEAGPKAKAARKASTSDYALADGPAPPQQANRRPVTLHVLPAPDTSDNTGEEHSSKPLAAGLTASEIPATALRSPHVSVSIAGADAQVAPLPQAVAHASERARTKDPSVDNAPIAAAPVPPQLANAAPVPPNPRPARDSDVNDGDNSERLPAVSVTATEIPTAALGDQLASVSVVSGGEQDAYPSVAVTEVGDRPRTRSGKKDSAPNNVPAAGVHGPTQGANTFLVARNPHAALDDSEGRDAGKAPPPQKLAEASAQPSPPLWTGRRMAPEENRPLTQAPPESPPDLDSPPLAAASASDGSLSKLEPAFEVRLQPAEPQPPPAATTIPAGSPLPEVPRLTMDHAPDNKPAPVETTETAAPAQSAPSNSRHGNDSPHPVPERPQALISGAPHLESGDPLTQAKLEVTAPTPQTASVMSSPIAGNRAEATASAEPAAEPEPQPVTAGPTAHDIKLELNGGGQRVEVRLTDRGGDIRVAVRTPDARLSDAMREDLPALTAKLEQAGFRADVNQSGAWQPGTTAVIERRSAEAGAASPPHDSPEHSGQDGQRRQDDPRQQNPKNSNNASNRKPDRKDFTWLLQTYR